MQKACKKKYEYEKFSVVTDAKTQARIRRAMKGTGHFRAGFVRLLIDEALTAREAARSVQS